MMRYQLNKKGLRMITQSDEIHAGNTGAGSVEFFYEAAAALMVFRIEEIPLAENLVIRF